MCCQGLVQLLMVVRQHPDWFILCFAQNGLGLVLNAFAPFVLEIGCRLFTYSLSVFVVVFVVIVVFMADLHQKCPLR